MGAVIILPDWRSYYPAGWAQLLFCRMGAVIILPDGRSYYPA
jgi:hypothetical protein